MITDVVYLEKPKRACGSTSYLMQMVAENPNVDFYVISITKSVTENITRSYRHLKNINVVHHNRVQGFANKLIGLREYILIFLDWNMKNEEHRQTVELYAAHARALNFGIIVEDTSKMKADVGLVYSPYIPLMKVKSYTKHWDII
jgi:hypothetical protein